jgi:glutamine amidotransferase
VIAIVDYGSGNIQAIGNILRRLDIPFAIGRRPEDLASADRLLLPGVGAFDQAMGELNGSGMREALDRCVLEDGKPVLGICVGLQLLAKSSEEGRAAGLGWLDAEVKRFDRSRLDHATRLPHMGWNSVAPLRPDPLFHGVESGTEFYFLHSYYFCCNDPADELAATEYGIPFTSAAKRGAIRGVQFHPEKSHQAGVQVLKNFALAVL